MSLADHTLLTQLYDETIGFRRLTGTPYSFDVQQYERYYLVRVARSLYYVSPIIRKIVDKPIMLFLENGLDIEFESDKVYNAYKEYVQSLPYTYSFENLIEIYLRAFAVDGELFVPLVKHKSGAIEFGYIPADMVLEVVHDEANGMVFKEIRYGKPNFSRDAIGSYYELSARENVAQIARIYKFKKRIEIEGDVLYYAVNNFPFMRGRSIIETVMDYAYAYDEFVTDRLRRQKLANTFVWDVEIQGAERETIQRRIEEFRRQPIPSSGGIRFHNEKEKWNIITPNLQSEDALKDSQIILSHISTGHNTVSKTEIGLENASQEEIELVARYINYVINRVFKPVVNGIVDTVLYATQNVGLLPKYSYSLDYQINYNRYHTEMIRHIAVSLYQTTSALKIARERGWMDDETAKCIIGEMVNKKIEKTKTAISVTEVNSIIATMAKALELGMIDEDTAKETIEYYVSKNNFEIIGGAKSFDMRGRLNKGTGDIQKPNLPVGES
ncbi:MAG: hypothetical protein NZM44_07635 [Candidatus Calescibacterium sp.]|nr:hypothetical protein [Candidatus Calescibacterium sp.]